MQFDRLVAAVLQPKIWLDVSCSFGAFALAFSDPTTTLPCLPIAIAPLVAPLAREAIANSGSKRKLSEMTAAVAAVAAVGTAAATSSTSGNSGAGPASAEPTDSTADIEVSAEELPSAQERQAQAANAALQANFELHDLAALGARGQHADRCEVWSGAGPQSTKWQQIWQDVVALTTAPEDDHVQAELSVLEKAANLDALNEIKNVLKPLIDGGYRVADCFLVLRRGDTSPMHQDKMTGSDAFARTGHIGWHATARPALRVLINLGSYAAGSVGERPMRFTLSDGTPLLQSMARIVLMDANAAGSGGSSMSNVFHGRIGDGVTLSLDLVLPRIMERGVGKPDEEKVRGIAKFPRHKFIHRWLNDDRTMSRVQVALMQAGELSGMVAQAQARAQANAANANSPQAHCSRCLAWIGSDDTRGALIYGGVPFGRRLCVDCRGESYRLDNNALKLTHDFVCYGTCAGSCTGCRSMDSKEVSQMMVVAMAKSKRAQADQDLIDRAAAAQELDKVDLRRKRHCWRCGDREPSHWYTVLGRWMCRICQKWTDSCGFESLDDVERPYNCPTDCTTCDAKHPDSKLPSKVDLRVAETAKSARFALGAADGAPTPTNDAKHCAYCGATKAMPGVSFINSNGRFFCARQCRDRFAKQTGPYCCPSDCKGCRKSD